MQLLSSLFNRAPAESFKDPVVSQETFSKGSSSLSPVAPPPDSAQTRYTKLVWKAVMGKDSEPVYYEGKKIAAVWAGNDL
jgi:hypothetical protein